MRKIKVGINGFGRIGRQVFRALHQSYADRVEVTAINGTDVRVGDWNIHCFAERDPRQLIWRDYDVDIVVESTGIFRKASQAAVHRDNGAKKVIITAPAKDLSLIHI